MTMTHLEFESMAKNVVNGLEFDKENEYFMRFGRWITSKIVLTTKIAW